jgi:hypothetical protein
VKVHLAKGKTVGRGWHGDSEGHSKAGRKGGRASSKNKMKQNPMSSMEEDEKRNDWGMSDDEDTY